LLNRHKLYNEALRRQHHIPPVRSFLELPGKTNVNYLTRRSSCSYFQTAEELWGRGFTSRVLPKVIFEICSPQTVKCLANIKRGISGEELSSDRVLLVKYLHREHLTPAEHARVDDRVMELCAAEWVSCMEEFEERETPLTLYRDPTHVDR
jgi:hypothetical protein